MLKICKAIPDQSHRIRAPRLNPTESGQQKGMRWQMKHLPRRSLPGEGPLCSVVEDNVSIQRLSHSRTGVERLRPSCIPSQRLSLLLELWGIRSKQHLQPKMSLEVALRELLSFGSYRHQIQSQLGA